MIVSWTKHEPIPGHILHPYLLDIWAWASQLQNFNILNLYRKAHLAADCLGSFAVNHAGT